MELPYPALSSDISQQWLIEGDGEVSQTFSLGATGSWRLRAHRLAGDYYSRDAEVPEQWLMQWWPAPVSRPQWLHRLANDDEALAVAVAEPANAAEGREQPGGTAAGWSYRRTPYASSDSSSNRAS